MFPLHTIVRQLSKWGKTHTRIYNVAHRFHLCCCWPPCPTPPSAWSPYWPLRCSPQGWRSWRWITRMSQSSSRTSKTGATTRVHVLWNRTPCPGLRSDFLLELGLSLDLQILQHIITKSQLHPVEALGRWRPRPHLHSYFCFLFICESLKIYIYSAIISVKKWQTHKKKRSSLKLTRLRSSKWHLPQGQDYIAIHNEIEEIENAKISSRTHTTTLSISGLCCRWVYSCHVSFALIFRLLIGLRDHGPRISIQPASYGQIWRKS